MKQMKKAIVAILWLCVLAASLTVSVFADAPVESVADETTLETTAETATAPVGLCRCDTEAATKYCPTCGGLHPAYARAWDCASCDTQDNVTAFCPACGAGHPNHDGCWDCPTCDAKDNFSLVCATCGGERPDENAGKTNFRIDVDSLKTTLPIMGMGMLGIFLVIGAIALSVMILRKLPEKKEE